MGAQANELPRARIDLRTSRTKLQRVADSNGGIWCVTQERSIRSPYGLDACSPFHPGRHTYFLLRRSGEHTSSAQHTPRQKLTISQIESEILGLFDFLKEVYGKFGFTFRLKLSTRPEGFLGEIETWNKAEKRLQKALEAFAAEGGAKWELNPGDGAFYGPKIDVMVSDALKREFQCATLQLDFQLPQQFNLEYMTAEVSKARNEEDGVSKVTEAVSKVASALTPSVNGEKKEAPKETPKEAPTGADEQHPRQPQADAGGPPEKSYRKPLTPGYARPVMIHRAIYGSFERFFAIITEHFAGKWPFWLSPRQILVVPVMPQANDYVLEVQALFRAKGFHVDADVTGNTMKKKILNGQMQQYNFIFVVGAEERDSRTVNIRDRDDQSTQQRGEVISMDDAIKKMEDLRDTKAFKLAAIM